MKTSLTLIFIVVAGTVLRLYGIDFQSLWVDELYSVVPTAPEQTVPEIIEYCKSDQPPVFFLFIHQVFKLFGYTSFIGRTACALVGVLGIVGMFMLGREIKDNRLGLIAALLTTINYFHLYYSQELRFYSLTFLLSTVSYLFFIRGIRHGKLIDYGLYWLATVLLLYTHYFGMFLFGTQAVIFGVLAFKRQEKRFIITGFLAGLFVAISFIPWLPTVISDMGISDQTFWIRPPKPWFVADYFYRYTGKDAATSAILVGLILLFVLEYKKAVKQKDESGSKETRVLYFIISAWLLLSYVLPYIKSIVSTPVLHERYTIIALPAWIIIFAIGLNSIKEARWQKIVMAALVVAFSINLLFFRKYYTRITKEQFREASNFVLQNNAENLPIYAPLHWHYSFYFRGQSQKALAFYKSERKHLDKIWFLQGHFSEEEKKPLMDLVYQEFDLLESHEFLGAEALLLQRKKGVD